MPGFTFYSPELLTQNKTSDGWNCVCWMVQHDWAQLSSGPHSLSSFFSFFFPSHMPLAKELVQSNAAISFSSLNKILITGTRLYLSLCTCYTSLNTFCHGALSAAKMFSLLLRCMINYLILVQLGSHHLWSGSTLTFLWLLWEMEKKSIGGKKKESRRMACE